MAGFFGLFDHTKPGKGVSKDAPKKKTFFLFFEYFLGNFWRFMSINLIYCLISIPLITNGLANAGLAHVTRNISINKHSFGLSDFFETIKKNWKQGLIAGIINTVVYVLIAFDFYFFLLLEDSVFKTIGLAVAFVFVITFTIMNFYIWTMMITLNYKLTQIYKNAFRFTFIAIWRNILCLALIVLISVVGVGLMFLFEEYSLYILAAEVLITILCYPAFVHLMTQFVAFPVLKKYVIEPYYREHPDDDIELRRSLGVEIEDEDEDEEDEDDEEDDGIIFRD